MKMRNDHIVPLAKQAVDLLRHVQPISGHGRYVFPSIRTDDRCMMKVREQITCLPSFPKAIRLPSKDRAAQSLYNAGEVIEWAMRHRERN